MVKSTSKKKTETSVKLNMPAFVKRVRKTWDSNREKISADGDYVDELGRVDIIGAGLTPRQLKVITDQGDNSNTIDNLIRSGTVVVEKQYAERLAKLQDAYDNGNKEQVRLRFRHLEASVKKAYPQQFKA